MNSPGRTASSLALAIVTLALSAGAGLAVPPSSWTPGISDLELSLTRATVPSLVAAVVLALLAVGLAWAGKARYAGLFEVLSVLFVNLAGLLAGQYGVDGAGLIVTLPLTAPVALIAAMRETAWRRAEGR